MRFLGKNNEKNGDKKPLFSSGPRWQGDLSNGQSAFRDQIVHVVALLDTPVCVATVVMEDVATS
jgi:hypothetical protein